MIKEITVDQLDNLENPIYIDVRSENEYQEATIPGAINLPLLNNEERIQVGTIYTQASPREAKDVGLQIIAPKLPNLMSEVSKFVTNGPIVTFCWRGGMRSKSFASVADLMGYPIYRLKGGYKAYRKHVINYFASPLPFHVTVLRGNTGVGKTELIDKLKDNGFPAIDLEKLANNRGSVFGAMGLGAPPSQKMFESLLYEELSKITEYDYIIVECESKRIGRVTLPNEFYQAMQEGTQVLIYDEIENRVNRLINEYTSMQGADDEIRNAVSKLNKRLGSQTIAAYLELLDNKQYEEFTRRLLIEYYDKLYSYPNEPSDKYNYSVLNNSEGIKKLEEYLGSFDRNIQTTALS